MKKKMVLVIFVVCLLSTGLFAFDISIGFSINRSFGNTDFFDLVQRTQVTNGRTFVEKDEKEMGFGFNFCVIIPLVKNLYINPEFSINNGNKHYEFVEAANQGNGVETKEDYGFMVNTWGINLVYRLLSLKSGWNINLFSGLNLNYFDGDKAAKLDIDNYLGYKLGVGFYFQPLAHFGFKARAYLNNSFSDPEDNKIGYATIELGIIYILKVFN